MQLVKIKIAGFKTFVDPTTVMLPSNLVAIVGPNGCGKSNIIDAVTWVMGESSPKYLRGESSTDVIFNGSSSRKPVGQASVELVFDNTDGAIGGEYHQYAEISIKRMINRDSDSTYYLNGVRCRKRDVVDIFLGTGLGPRSYSIIGQNMISKIIEAKPDDLRTYLEEAAGISKYKERRHETELRIQHTKENLDRVQDVYGELEKQLSHLKHQANVAEKYKTLKEQERTLRAECYVAEWRELDSRMVDLTLNIQREETALEARSSDMVSADKDLEQMRNEKQTANDSFQEIQRRYYATGNDITRIEQAISHTQDKQRQWENDLKQVDTDYATVQTEIEQNETALAEAGALMANQAPEHAALKEAVEHLDATLQAEEDDMQDWQNRWESFNAQVAKAKQTVQVEKTHIQHLEERIHLLQKRKAQINENLQHIKVDDLDSEINQFNLQSAELETQLALQLNQVESVKHQLTEAIRKEKEAKAELDAIRSELQQQRGQQASLLALQQTALGQRDNPTIGWVEKHQLNQKARLAQHIEVANGWELAVEKVLGIALQAIEIKDMDAVLSHLNDFETGRLMAFTPEVCASSIPKAHKAGVLLAEKITAPWSLDAFITGIYAAESLDEALTLRQSLSANESVITKEGIWLNAHWIKVLRDSDPAAGIFEREQALKELAATIQVLETRKIACEENITRYTAQITQFEQERDSAFAAYNDQKARSVEVATQQKLKQERFSELQDQSHRYIKERDECEVNLAKSQTELSQAKSLLARTEEEVANHEETLQVLTDERDAIRQKLQTIRHQTEDKRDELHEFEIRQESLKAKHQSLSQNQSHLQKQLAILKERHAHLHNELAEIEPLEKMKEKLTIHLNMHVKIEDELNNARQSLEILDQDFRQLEEKRHSCEKESNQIREKLEKYRVTLQGLKVKADTLLQQLTQTEFTLEETLKNLPQDIDIKEWQGKLEQVCARIQRLGAINLVAIEEYATCLERKEYLDKQINDLQAGLKTLEDAIHKIDKETKTRFKETFDQVNERFQVLFPTIFGGGKSYLELTSDDLLEAGVTVMASPPGKRNSTIHLLSGGEKTLTAIALIFSIFHLNPAPFCLLDEVDAALDDANVLRFTKLVKSMADKTQFIYISHNKITIEIAEHLIGVTMNEPGVSRLVTVDINKAMTLAGVEDRDSAESSHA